MKEGLLPFVRVIIPVYEDWERLAICLEALDKQTYPASNFEVVVVDNGSSTIPPSGSYHFSLQTKVCQKPGSYSARNMGLRGGHADVYAFTDADCIPEPDWIKNGVNALQAPDNAHDLAAGKIHLFAKDPHRPTAAELVELAIEFNQERSVSRKGKAVTANLFVKQHVIKALEGFDERVRSGGDIDFTKRARRAGYSITYVDNAVIRHPARLRIKELYDKTRRKAGGAIDASTGWRKVLPLLSVFKPPIRKLIRILQSERLSITERMRAVCVLILIRFAFAHEWISIVLFRKQSTR